MSIVSLCVQFLACAAAFLDEVPDQGLATKGQAGF
jgi:hypothetical protein